MYVGHIEQALDEAQILRDLAAGPNDAVRSDYQTRMNVNRHREASGQQPLTPPRNFRVGYPRIASLETNRMYGSNASRLPHNIRRKPKRQPSRKVRR